MNDVEHSRARLQQKTRRDCWIRRLLLAAGVFLVGSWALLGYLERHWVLELQQRQLTAMAKEAELLERSLQVAQDQAVAELSNAARLSNTPRDALALLDHDDLSQLAGNYLDQMEDARANDCLALNNVAFLIIENEPHLDHHASALVEKVLPLVDDADTRLAWHAIDALQGLKWRSKPAWSKLLEIAADLENPLAPKAIAALCQIDPESEQIPYPHLAVVGSIHWEALQGHLPKSDAPPVPDEELEAVLARIKADEKRRLKHQGQLAPSP